MVVLEVLAIVAVFAIIDEFLVLIFVFHCFFDLCIFLRELLVLLSPLLRILIGFFGGEQQRTNKRHV